MGVTGLPASRARQPSLIAHHRAATVGLLITNAFGRCPTTALALLLFIGLQPGAPSP